MITVYHLEHSRSQRILWLLEELDVKYQLERFARDPTGRAPDAYRKTHPLGKSPAIRDGDLVLAESGAIVEYLVERYGNGRLAPPPGDPARARYLYWFHAAEGTAMLWIVVCIVLGMAGDATAPIRGALGGEITRFFDYMEREFGDGPYLVGASFSAADVMMGYVVEVAAEQGFLGEHPRLRAYLARLRERPAYRRAQQHG
jgi:glutathione S-transferase